MAKKNIITLGKPIQAHGKTITELSVREPTLAVLEGVDIEIRGNGGVKLSLSALVPIVAELTDIPPSSARDLNFSDLYQLAEPVMGFFEKFLPTGEE